MTNQTNQIVHPLNDKVIVAMLPRQTVSAGGIAIPDCAQQVEEWGVVESAGPKCQHVTAGDEVFVPAHLGTWFVSNGHDYVLIEEHRILAKRTAAAA
jgi:co-chaperonin GroES (HSP10)